MSPTRTTKQKQLIAQLIKQAGRPLTAQEILALSQQTMPRLGLATVYRELSRLHDEQQISIIHIADDSPRYETIKPHHHHFKCTLCKTIFDLPCNDLNIQYITPEGFVHHDHHLTLFGWCRQCHHASVDATHVT
jgi:Fur family ferric uptake transcriptional regulator